MLYDGPMELLKEIESKGFIYRKIGEGKVNSF